MGRESQNKKDGGGGRKGKRLQTNPYIAERSVILLAAAPLILTLLSSMPYVPRIR